MVEAGENKIPQDSDTLRDKLPDRLKPDDYDILTNKIRVGEEHPKDDKKKGFFSVNSQC